jgi:hypothetical protein
LTFKSLTETMHVPLEAVMTADVVRSSLLSEAVFAGLASHIEAMARGGGAMDFNGFHKGNDAFQCCVPDAREGLRLALRMRTAAIGFGGTAEGVPLTDLRVSLGIGPLAGGPHSEGRGLGAAWVLSGRGLETLKRGDRRMWLEGTDAKANIALEAVSRFVDHLFLKLTVKQAEVLGLLLEGLTQTEVASRLSKSQSTVSSHVQAMAWREVDAALRLYAEAVAKSEG